MNTANGACGLHKRRVGRAFAAQLLLIPAALQADDAALYGAWMGGDRASEAIYETMAIDRRTIAWGSPDNPNGGRCRMDWRPAYAGHGETYHGNPFGGQAGRVFSIHAIALDVADCARGARYLLFALPSDASPAGSRAEVASFDEHWNLTGWHNFTRVPAAGD